MVDEVKAVDGTVSDEGKFLADRFLRIYMVLTASITPIKEKESTHPRLSIMVMAMN